MGDPPGILPDEVFAEGPDDLGRGFLEPQAPDSPKPTSPSSVVTFTYRKRLM